MKFLIPPTWGRWGTRGWGTLLNIGSARSHQEPHLQSGVGAGMG